MVRFHESLSERTVYLRYLQSLKLSQRVAHERLRRICFIDFDREIALLALPRDGNGQEAEIAGVARLVQAAGQKRAEFALIVADPFQGEGIGAELLHRLVDVAKAEGLEALTGEILAENYVMQKLVRKHGFKILPYEPGDPTVEVVLPLG